jgi:hypothetical protein
MHAIFTKKVLESHGGIANGQTSDISFTAAIHKEHGIYSRVDEMTVLNLSFGFFGFILACEFGCPCLFHKMIVTNNHRSFLTFKQLS